MGWGAVLRCDTKGQEGWGGVGGRPKETGQPCCAEEFMHRLPDVQRGVVKHAQHHLKLLLVVPGK